MNHSTIVRRLRRGFAAITRAQRPFSWVLCCWLSSQAVFAEPFARAFEFSPKYPTGSTYMHIRLLGALQLPSVTSTGESVAELSDLAWDEDAQVLYAISDGGALFQFRPQFKNERLVGLDFLSKHALQDQKGRALRGVHADAEGLDIEGARNGTPSDTRLTVSFERITRVVRYTPEGKWIEAVKIPEELRAKKAFRSPNKGLEAFTYYQPTQWLASPEWPRTDAATSHHELFSPTGRRVTFRRHPAKSSALVAISPLPNQKVLTLERSYDSATASVVIALRVLPPASQWSPHREVEAPLIAEFNSFGDWFIDNFEGLTRHQGNRFFIVSDDNENIFQKTLLVYFEVIEP